MTDPVTELDDGQRKVLPKIEALLRLADKAKNSSPAEAASAAAKAQELLIAYNLDAGMVDANGSDGRREEQKFDGGFYRYARDLWQGVADLNFCLHFVSGEYVTKRTIVREFDGTRRSVTKPTWTKRHRLIGKHVNVLATQQMALYLIQTIERLAMNFVHNDPKMRVSKRAMSFREGAASTVVNALYDRRRHLMREEQRVAREAAEAAERAGRAGVSTSTALTISSVRQTEADANADFINGEGWSARRRAQRAAEAQARQEAEAAYTQWAEANPEEARAAAEKERKEEEARERRRDRYVPRGGYRGNIRNERDDGAYYAGRAAAKAISLDQQMANPIKGKLS